MEVDGATGAVRSRRACQRGARRVPEAVDRTTVNQYAFMVHRIPVGVLGASGYAGRELCALVNAHPHLQLAFATANAQRGELARLGGRDVRFVATEDAALTSAELVF